MKNDTRLLRALLAKARDALVELNQSTRDGGGLLRAIAAFAVGGLTALSDLRTDAARKLLGQLK